MVADIQYYIQENPETGEVVWYNQTRVSPILADLLPKMVRYHYRDRYQSATEVLQNFRKLLSFFLLLLKLDLRKVARTRL
jgi:hypothetical protein